MFSTLALPVVELLVEVRLAMMLVGTALLKMIVPVGESVVPGVPMTSPPVPSALAVP
jgi:hypothetical protein